MKNNLFFLVFSLFYTIESSTQNSAYYNINTQNNTIEWYFQLNTDPVIIQNGIVNENVYPNWYNAYQFLNCPGVFDTEDEAYNYIASNPVFIDPSNYSYEDITRADKKVSYVQGFKDILNRSISYATDSEAKKDDNSLVLSGCREQVVFAEMYLKYNGYEILFIYSMPMYLSDLDVSSTTDIQKIIGALKKDITPVPHDYNMSLSFFLKENGIWKYVNFDKMDNYLKTNIVSLDFTTINDKPIIHIESSLDMSGNRIYIEK